MNFDTRCQALQLRCLVHGLELRNSGHKTLALVILNDKIMSVRVTCESFSGIVLLSFDTID